MFLRLRRKRPRLRRAVLLFTLTLFLYGVAPVLAAPSLEAMAGQMLMVGFKGQEPETCAAILDDIRTRHLGGVILFSRDVRQPRVRRNIRDAQQVRRLVGALRAASAIPLFVGVDQEGGRVSRFSPADGFPAFPSAAELGRGTPEATRETARRMGDMLRGLGINLDFAPVLDVDVNPDSPAIGRLERSFSADPQRVAAQGAAFAEGLRASGVVPVFKHFPGHGSARTDSHAGVTDVSATWSERELLPYAALLGRPGPRMVMVGHLFHRGLDPDVPATLSPLVIDGLLRHRLGYEGVVVTDDLQMRAISDHYPLEEVVLGAVDAGADVLLFGNNLDYDPALVSRAQGIIVRAVREGRLSQERLESSWRRIMALKETLRLSGPPSVPGL